MIRSLVPVLTFVLAAAALPAQNPYLRAGASIAVVNDIRARNVGDILTITIQEKHTVDTQDKVERHSDTSLGARLEAWTIRPNTFPEGVLPRIEIEKESEFDGESKQRANSDVRASVAVIVIDVQPNGNLVVAGTREVTVNDEKKTLKISGLVRPLDVSPENTVGSQQVADARIAITGDGAGTRQVTRGPVGALFETLIWAAWPF